jgi:hypothetical protein
MTWHINIDIYTLSLFYLLFIQLLFLFLKTQALHGSIAAAAPNPNFLFIFIFITIRYNRLSVLCYVIYHSSFIINIIFWEYHIVASTRYVMLFMIHHSLYHQSFTYIWDRHRRHHRLH